MKHTGRTRTAQSKSGLQGHSILSSYIINEAPIMQLGRLKIEVKMQRPMPVFCFSQKQQTNPEDQR